MPIRRLARPPGLVSLQNGEPGAVDGICRQSSDHLMLATMGAPGKTNCVEPGPINSVEGRLFRLAVTRLAAREPFAEAALVVSKVRERLRLS